jgi:hypothetical protein|tara:strand:+ start:212 stop:385 length:174 start_codon:yes stop_codon:yes gene_type:complete
MTNEELQEKLENITKLLKKAHSDNDKDKVNYYVSLLNSLWEEASIHMKNNSKADGFE